MGSGKGSGRTRALQGWWPGGHADWALHSLSQVLTLSSFSPSFAMTCATGSLGADGGTAPHHPSAWLAVGSSHNCVLTEQTFHELALFTFFQALGIGRDWPGLACGAGGVTACFPSMAALGPAGGALPPPPGEAPCCGVRSWAAGGFVPACCQQRASRNGCSWERQEGRHFSVSAEVSS